MPAASSASDPTLSAALSSRPAVWVRVVAPWARMLSSSVSDESAWRSIGESAPTVPTSLPPASEKESSEPESSGIVVPASLDCRSTRPCVLFWMASLTVPERFLTESLSALMSLDICCRRASWSFCVCVSWTRTSTSCWSSVSILCWISTSAPSGSLMLAMVSLDVSSVVLRLWVVPSSAWICAMAASTLPWAQPMSPVIWPMS